MQNRDQWISLVSGKAKVFLTDESVLNALSFRYHCIPVFFKKKLFKKLIIMASRENDIIYLLSVSIKGQPEISVGRL